MEGNMTDAADLEKKLMGFYSHYRTLDVMVKFYTNTILSDDSNEISRSEIDCIFETLSEKMNGQLNALTKIIDKFQETYCNTETELV